MLQTKLPGRRLPPLDGNLGVVNEVALLAGQHIGAKRGLLTTATVQHAAKLEINVLAFTAVLVIAVGPRHGLHVIVLAGG